VRAGKICRWRFAGLVPYGEGRLLQRDLVRRRLAGEIPDTLLLVEHPHVITLGKMARPEHVRRTRPGVEVVETDRGGDVTYHGPGQIVAYPILDLREHRRDVRWYLDRLEEVMIRVVARYGLRGERRPGATGVWVGGAKIGSIGVRVERWITSHGFALNVATDLSYFDLIVPCGLEGVRMTSLEKEVGRAVDPGEVRRGVVEAFGGVFHRVMEEIPG